MRIGRYLSSVRHVCGEKGGQHDQCSVVIAPGEDGADDAGDDGKQYLKQIVDSDAIQLKHEQQQVDAGEEADDAGHQSR